LAGAAAECPGVTVSIVPGVLALSPFTPEPIALMLSTGREPPDVPVEEALLPALSGALLHAIKKNNAPNITMIDLFITAFTSSNNAGMIGF